IRNDINMPLCDLRQSNGETAPNDESTVLQQQAQTDGKRISYVDLRYDSGAGAGKVAPAPVRLASYQKFKAGQ
ncbi:hypothetical protein O5559_28745, partial [Escherichia coli]|nr:hypothetical protein [Escherichia coli]